MNDLPGTQKLAVQPAVAAKMAGISRSTLYEEMGSGRLRSRKLGRRRVILVSDLQAWLEGLPDGC